MAELFTSQEVILTPIKDLLGSINNYVDIILAFFDQLLTSTWTKSDIFGPPTYLFLSTYISS